MGYVIAVVNNKGGVGKTTLSINLGHCTANKGVKTLAVDLDPQCNLTSTLIDPGKVQDTVYELLGDEEAPELSSLIYPTDYEKFYVMPNIEETAALEPDLIERADRFSLLKDRLRPYARENFDMTFIDCPPNLGTFSVMAMVAADFVIVPVEGGSRYALDGLDKTVRAIETIRASHNPDLRFLRLLLNKVDRRTTVSRILIDQIRANYNDKVFDTMVPINTDVQQAELAKKSVVRFAPRSLGSKAFRKLAKELLAILDLDT